MANLDIGINLDNRTLSLNIPDDTTIAELKYIAKVNSNNYIAEDNENGVSRGYYHFLNENNEAETAIFYQYDGNSTSVNLESFTLPDNFGTITEVNETATLYEYINRNIHEKVYVISEDFAKTESMGKNDIKSFIRGYGVPINSVFNYEGTDTPEGFVEVGEVTTTLYYKTLQDMKTSNLEPGNTAITLGYYEIDDGGGSIYTIEDDDTLTDDGGSVIDLENGLKAILIAKDEVNINQFGAKGDGIVDNTSAIQSAIDYCFGRGIKLIIPEADVYYKITKPLILNIDKAPTEIGYWGGYANTIIGLSKAKSRIVKIGTDVIENNTNPNINNKNATFLCINSTQSNKTGTGVTLDNLSIENYLNTNLEKTEGSYSVYTNISRSNYKNLNIISYYGIHAESFSSLFENIVFKCTEKALYVSNGTSNLFRFLYAPACKDPYYIHSQYSILLSVCCDNAKGDLFTLGGMGLSLQSCGCESKNATNIFVIDTQFTTLSIRDFYMHRQVGYADESIAPEDCSILKVNNACPIDIENISIVETEAITGTSYFINCTSDSSLTTNIKNIRYYKNYSSSSSNDKIKMWKNKPATQAIQRLSTPTMNYNYFVDSNLNLVPFIGGYNSSDNSTVQGYVIDTAETHNKTIWLNNKTKYTAEDGSDTRYSGRHNVGDVQLYNDPLAMNALGLSITHVTNNYTWDTNEIPIVLRGTTADRPSSNKYLGLQYFDTTLGKPIWWDGSNWVDSTGTNV